MVANTFFEQTGRLKRSGSRSVRPWIAFGLLLAAIPVTVCAESPGDAADPFEMAQQAEDSAPKIESTLAAAEDPFEAGPAVYDPFLSAAPVNMAAYFPEPPAIDAQHEFVYLQSRSNQPSAPIERNINLDAPPAQDTKQQVTTDPCAGASDKPLCELGINIMLPSGLLPKDYAAACWAERNAVGGPFGATRCWPVQPYFWDAPCLCYRPLYFEEINLERHGYGCCCQCLQPAFSAAHFFGTIPALPYCMADHCPCECEYTLGHYRPGSCPPRRCNWPSCKPIAAAAEAGVVTGLIFVIP